MAVYNQIGSRRRHDGSDAVPLLTDKLHVNVANFSAYVRFFVKVLIEMNENISNELNFSDVYRSVNYIGLLAKFT